MTKASRQLQGALGAARRTFSVSTGATPQDTCSPTRNGLVQMPQSARASVMPPGLGSETGPPHHPVPTQGQDTHQVGP